MIVKDKVNAIARIVYLAMNYTAPVGYDFEFAVHTAEKNCWVAALRIWEEMAGDSPDLEAELE